jgi:anti-sigma B factor antagonist
VPDETHPENATATALTVELSGEYDIARTAELRDALLSPHRGETEVVADLKTVTFMDSTALRSLLEVRAELERRGATFRMVNPGPMVDRLLDVTGTADVFGLSRPDSNG